CQRFLRDLDRTDIYFDPAAADRAILFIESFRHYKGRFAGQRLKMEPWQKFVVGNIFGWKWAGSGLRRFKYAHIEVPRKNGKTLLAAGIAIYLLCADGEGGAEVYNAATKKDQAMLLHKDARVLIQKCKDPDFISAFEIRRNPAGIEYESASAMMKPLGRDTEGLTTDGLNPHGVIADETHAWPTMDFWNVLNSALGAREQPLVLMITTAGHLLEGVGKSFSNTVETILSGESDDSDDFFGIKYTVDEGDDLENPLTWEKANPLYGITVDEKKCRSQLSLAKTNPAILNEFKTKWMNIWINQGSAWLDSEKWAKCVLPEVTEADLVGMRCYGGLDLAITRDLSALVWAFPPQGLMERWTFLSRFWCPAEDIRVRSTRDKVPYQTWASKGFIYPTPGEVMDHGYIHRQMVEDAKKFDVRAVGYDRTFMANIVNPMVDAGLNMLAFSQGILLISPYAKELEAMIIAGRLNHMAHPVLTWNAGNVVVHTDANGNIKPDKKKSVKRIDGIVAGIMALGVGIEMENELSGGDFEVTVVGGR
ncbi:MAG: terminase large subunit, partial [Akkermansiaceae bacterium]|nr:terminase large subunit [Akkermansiaceae bacterium]